MDRVVIGVDPHKKSVTFEARDTREIMRANDVDTDKRRRTIASLPDRS